MKFYAHHGCRRILAVLLTVVTVLSMLPGAAFAIQDSAYHDPAEHWTETAKRLDTFDANAIVTTGTIYCYVCEKYTSAIGWRVPEYSRDGQTAMTRNVKYSDGTLFGGEGTGTILDGVPGVDAYYTGFHWTKTCCNTCGVMNSNFVASNYGHGKNLYWLYDCDSVFMEVLDETVTYEYMDDTYHTKTVSGGSYCAFCYGTRYSDETVLERHTLNTEVIPQIDRQRFVVVTSCSDCEYTGTEYVAAKSVIADYYGAVDGQAHTLTVSDLSESGVSAKVRFGNSADACTLTAPPNYTEEGQYTVYYEITYTYKSASMTENGVAYVWLHNERMKEPVHPGVHSPDSAEHNYVYLDSVAPTCYTLGYDRYLCPICGSIDKRNYVNVTGHAYQSVLIREADCDHEGKVFEICRNCGVAKETVAPKGEHQYRTYKVSAACTAPGYTVRECSVCDERQILDVTAVLGHSYAAHTIAPTCTEGGYTTYICSRCEDAYIAGLTDPLGHDWDEGVKVTDVTCNSEGVIEHRCTRCNEHLLEAASAKGHNPGPAATCTEAQLCLDCGAVLEKAHRRVRGKQA